MVRFKRADTADELKQILQLQQKNLPDGLSSEIKKTEGYVTVKHDLELLDQMNKACKHFIAVSEDKVVGYALSMHPKFKDEIEVLRAMFREIERVHPEYDYIVMGQVCVDKDFRKQGIFRRLYQEMLDGIKPEFNCIITEVDIANPRSIDAHYGIGFETLSSYSSDGRDWKLIILK